MKWEFEEALLLIDLYQCCNRQDGNNIDEMISSLSHLLNIRASQLGYVVDDKFRNPTGIKMKLQNISFIASYGENGLSGYSDMDMKAYSFSLRHPSEFSKMVVEIKRKYVSSEPPTIAEKGKIIDDVSADFSLLSERYGLQPKKYKDINVGDLPISIRVKNCLNSIGIKYVCELLNCSFAELTSIRNFGVKCKNELHAYLCKLSKAEEDKSATRLPSIILENKEHIFSGDFTFFDEQNLSKCDSDIIEKYKEGYYILGKEFVSACYNGSSTVSSLIMALSSILTQEDSLYRQKHNIGVLISNLPNHRKKNAINGYIRAFTSDEGERAHLSHLLDNGDTTFNSLSLDKNLTDADYYKLKMFLKWCSFDMPSEITQLFNRLYSRDNMRVVIRNRASHKTLDQIGKQLGVTRERIRQIELKAKKIFAQWQKKNRLVSKIFAERNGDEILTPIEITDFCGEYATEILYFLKGFKSSAYSYDSQLDVFIVENETVSERLQEYIGNLPDIFNEKSLPDIFEMAEECDDIPRELLDRALLDEYKLTGHTYHRSRLSLSKMYSLILNRFYPDGIKAYDDIELSLFRKRIMEEYGDVNVPQNNRAIAARIANIGILCGKGMYKPKAEKYASSALLKQIHNFIIQSNSPILMTNTLFSEFEDELIAEGIKNKYYLHGILHELYGDEFVFHRDYVSKDESFTSIYAEIIHFIRQSEYPVSKKQLQAAFPGVTEIVFSLSIADANVLNFFGEYLYATKLKISDDERGYLLYLTENLIADNNAHHCKEAFDLIMRNNPEILLRNAAAQPFCTYSILEYLFRDRFQFSRPYIAGHDVEIGRPGERLHDLIYSSDEITISDIRDFAKENHYQITSLLDFLISLNDNYIIADDNTLISITSSGIKSEYASIVEEEICKEVSDTLPICQLQCTEKFPQISIPWTDWLVFSTLKKWSSRLEVGVSNNQFRYANPLVSQAKRMNEGNFKTLPRSPGMLASADNLDDIDDLIAGYIENEVVL